MNRLPGVLGDIADCAGLAAALAVAQARGGTQVYIPPEPGEDHWLVEVIGLEAARTVAERLTCGVGGLRVDLPLGPAGCAARVRAEVDRLLGLGRSERDIALATRYSIRGIRRRRAQLGLAGDDRQLPLF